MLENGYYRDITDRFTLLQFYYQSAPRSVKRIIMNESAGAQTSVGSIAQQLGTNNALHESDTDTSIQKNEKEVTSVKTTTRLLSVSSSWMGRQQKRLVQLKARVSKSAPPAARPSPTICHWR
jgi:hypothetical protein